MKTLLLYGHHSEYKVGKILETYLTQYQSLLSIQSEQLSFPEGEYPLQIFEHNHLQHIKGQNLVLFLKDRANIEQLKSISSQCIIIVNSANKQYQEFMTSSVFDAPCVITYGFSSKDTVTFSSRDDHEYVISLQRSIKTVDGTILEPMEIPCRILGNCSDIILLAIVTILIVLNELHLENETQLIINCE